jgi:PEP-CTERM motif
VCEPEFLQVYGFVGVFSLGSKFACGVKYVTPGRSNMKTNRGFASASALGWLLVAGVVHAAPISVTGLLTGDPRTANPDNLVIKVTITSDTAQNYADWVVDIDSPLHPNAKLDEFYFSMSGAASDYSFSNYSPVGWLIETPASVQGGGNFNPTFMFQSSDPAGQPNAAEVTNAVNFTFRMTKASGNFLASDFLTAPSICSSEVILGCGQLGAHLQSLTIPQGSTSITTDSGFLLGSYTSGGGGGGGGGGNAPEPGSMALVGLALLALGVARKRAS